MLSTVAAPCFSVALVLASLAWNDVVLPVTLDLPNVTNISHIVCPRVDIGSISMSYNDTLLGLQVLETSVVQCHAYFNATGDNATLTLALELPPTDVAFAMEHGATNATRCDVVGATMTACSMGLRLVNVSVEPFNAVNLKWDELFAAVELAVDTLAPAALCALLNDSIVPALLNHTVDPALVPAAITPGLTDLSDSTLIATVLNIVRGLPVLFGFMEVRAFVSTPTSLEVEVVVSETWTLDVPPEGIAVTAVVPAGTSLSLQLWFKDLVCTAPFTCSVAHEGGVTVQNVRLRGAGEANRLMDNMIGPAVAALLSDALLAIINASVSYETKNGYRYATIQLTEADTNGQPPFALAVGLAALFSGCAIAVIGYSASRHTHRPVIGPDGNPISLRRVMAEDSFVVITCFLTMFLFAWSNSTEAAAVIMGDTYTMYTFSLRSTIQDLYSAGLYALCIFIALFCGFYPYFKLLAIVIFSVVLQRPQSKVLMFIDSCGKLSLLDTFMMIIMVTGLEVAGIAEVKMLASFYVFLVATFLSILVGNYATHGWRKEARGEPGTPLRINRGGLEQLDVSPRMKQSHSTLSSDDEVAKTPQEKRQWNWRVALPLSAIIIAGGVVGLTQVCLQYNLSGFATVVTGTERRFTMLDLFKATAWPIYATGLFTTIIAPILYSVGFPKSHVLGAWCATDAILLACVGGLVQLTQFVKFVMGPTLSMLYQAEAELKLPLAALLASMLAQWLLIGSEIFQVDLAAVCVSCVRRMWRRLRGTSGQLESTVSLKEGEATSYGSQEPKASKFFID